ncbi:hypothetical protein ANN_19987 [Periplaneta americana]|uniref:Uncharacterized protein n=1 Tax=Periplaneta americana TaxID=6978 RepID=A0ABQ8SC18_PERAM|nr:hypothetical protein ANN_19987 [Periplaneta americana]
MRLFRKNQGFTKLISRRSVAQAVERLPAELEVLSNMDSIPSWANSRGLWVAQLVEQLAKEGPEFYPSAEQSDGITVFRISPMASLKLHRCRTGAISLQRWWQSPSAAISESDWFLYRAGIKTNDIVHCCVMAITVHVIAKSRPNSHSAECAPSIMAVDIRQHVCLTWSRDTMGNNEGEGFGPVLWIEFGVAQWLERLELWPPRSPDLTTPDFFLWGYLKDRVYATRPQTLDDLKHNITQEIQANNRVLQRVASNMERRVELCLMQDGGHVQYLRKR